MGKARLRAGILGVAIGLTAGTMAIADPDTKGVQIEVAYTHDSNIARVRKEDNRLSDNVLSVDLSKQFIRQPSDHTEVLAAIVGGGERFQDFDGLSNAFIGLQIDGLYRSSGALSVPTYRAFLHATQVNYRSDIRDGYRITTGLSVQKYYEDQLKLIAELAYNARHGRDEVFNTRDVSVRGIAEYQVSLRMAFYAIGEYRDGDVVSSAAPSLAYVDLADAIASDDAFPGQRLVRVPFRCAYLRGDPGTQRYLRDFPSAGFFSALDQVCCQGQSRFRIPVGAPHLPGQPGFDRLSHPLLIQDTPS